MLHNGLIKPLWFNGLNDNNIDKITIIIIDKEAKCEKYSHKFTDIRVFTTVYVTGTV